MRVSPPGPRFCKRCFGRARKARQNRFERKLLLLRHRAPVPKVVSGPCRLLCYPLASFRVGAGHRWDLCVAGVPKEVHCDPFPVDSPPAQPSAACWSNAASSRTGAALMLLLCTLSVASILALPQGFSLEQRPTKSSRPSSSPTIDFALNGPPEKKLLLVIGRIGPELFTKMVGVSRKDPPEGFAPCFMAQITEISLDLT